MDQLQELYQDLILEHKNNPRHFGTLLDSTNHAKGHNPLCGDQIDLYLSIDENNIIRKIAFTGSGCAISTASASIMCDAILNKDLNTVRAYFKSFIELVRGDETPTEDLNLKHININGEIKLPAKIMAFSGVKMFPMRVKCASLAWHTFMDAISQIDQSLET